MIRKFISNVVLLCMLSLSIHNEVKPVGWVAGDNTPLIGAGVTLGLVLAVGTYLYLQKEDQEGEASDSFLTALAIASLPAVISSGLFYWIAGKYTVDGHKKYIEQVNKDVTNALSRKLNTGDENYFNDILNRSRFPNRAVNDLVNVTFGENSSAPLVDFVIFLRENRQQILKAIDSIEALRANDALDTQARELARKTTEASTVIMRSSDWALNHNDFGRQTRQYSNFRREESNRQDRAADRMSRWVNTAILAGYGSRTLIEIARACAGES